MAYYLGLKFVIVVQSLPLLLLAEEMQLLKDSVTSLEMAKIRPINRNQALVQIFTRHPWLTDKDR